MTRSYTIPRNFWRVVRRIQRDGTYSLCQLSYDVGQRVSIGARNQAPGFLFCMPYGRRPGGATHERRFTLRCPPKSFTRIAPTCAPGQEVPCPPRATEEGADPPRPGTKRSTPNAGQAEASSPPHPAAEN